MMVQGRPKSGADVRLAQDSVYHAEKGEERSSGQFWKPLTQEPQSSHSLFDEAVRPKGSTVKHAKTHDSTAATRWHITISQTTHDRAHKYWQMRTAKARTPSCPEVDPSTAHTTLSFSCSLIFADHLLGFCIFSQTNTFSSRMLKSFKCCSEEQ